LQFLNKEIVVLLKQKGAKKSIYYMYPEKDIQSGHLNPIFPHNVIRYELLKANRAEIIFGFTEEGVYIARTFTVDDPNFKKKLDEEKPFKAHEFGISPKLSLIMLNFLNLFEDRKNKKILDPFVGSGSILLLGLLQEFQIYGSDIKENKVSNTLRNIRWLLRELEEPMPQLLKQRIRTIDVRQLSTFFQPDFFDGIITEPYLGPPFKEKPNYVRAKELLENELEPLYDVLFREVCQILKKNGRICTISPIISTSEGKDIQLDLNKIAEKYKFKAIPMIDTNRIINKSNIKLQFPKYQRNLIDVKKGQIIKRKIYVFEKQN
jgi:tRNA G10  N-methylase Trm11